MISDRPKLTLPCYFNADAAVAIITIFSLCWFVLGHYAHSFIMHYLFETHLETHQPVTWMDYIPLIGWRFFQVVVFSQLALLFPYIATSLKSSGAGIRKNLLALYGNRWRVLVVLLFIGILPIEIAPRFARAAGSWVDGRENFLLKSAIDSTVYQAFWFLSGVFEAIFYAKLFQLLGTRGAEDNQRPAA